MVIQHGRAFEIVKWSEVSAFPAPFLCLVSCFLFLFLCGSAAAVCTPGTTWTASWTDGFNQTTYTLEAPCKVFIDTPFTITATVTDSSYPNDWVASGWSITDNAVIVPGESGFSIDTSGGQWQHAIQQTYTGTPVDHTILFSFTDLGQGGGGHQYGTNVIGGLTVDPYPQPLGPVKRIYGGGNVWYDPTPADAYLKVRQDGEVIECAQGAYDGVTFDQPYAIILEGGFIDQDFVNNTDTFSDISFVTVLDGSVTVENITIQ